MEKPLIYLISDGSIDADNFSTKSNELFELVEAAFTCGVSMIQIREKQLPARQVFQLTEDILKIRQKSDTRILVNERFDIALAAKADGVHLTSNSLSANLIRQSCPTDFIIGVSTHTLAEVRKVKEEGADFALFAPIFHSPNKSTPQGVKKLAEVVDAVKSFPIIALGGISEENYNRALNAGASGIAAIRMLKNPQNLPRIVRRIRGEENAETTDLPEHRRS